MARVDYRHTRSRAYVIGPHKLSHYSFDPYSPHFTDKFITDRVLQERAILHLQDYSTFPGAPLMHLDTFFEFIFKHYAPGFVPRVHIRKGYSFGDNYSYRYFDTEMFVHERDKSKNVGYLVTVPPRLERMLAIFFEDNIKRINNIRNDVIRPHFVPTLHLNNFQEAADYLFPRESKKRSEFHQLFGHHSFSRELFPVPLNIAYSPELDQYMLYFTSKRFRNFFCYEPKNAMFPLANTSLSPLLDLPLTLSPKRS